MTKSVKELVSAEEWEERVKLAATYRLVSHFHWDDLIFTHLTARAPGPEHHFLINPYGMLFDEITASSLVKIDLSGKKVLDSPYEINPAGFTIHSAIHAARDDAKCVLHVHSLNGIAVSAQKGGVLPISQQSIFILLVARLSQLRRRRAPRRREAAARRGPRRQNIFHVAEITVCSPSPTTCPTHFSLSICSKALARFKCARRPAAASSFRFIRKSSKARRLRGKQSHAAPADHSRGAASFASWTRIDASYRD